MNDRANTPSTPRATYRLQFGKDFRFDDARRIVPYLAALGVSHVYASPLLMARAGSTHGYDIVDHNRLNPEIGAPGEFDALAAELQRHGMGLILDFVPNHMGIGQDNPWWVDVLEWGRASPYAEFFDIDWEPLEPTLAGKVLLPVLGSHYGAVLERGELQLRLDAEKGTVSVVYFDHPFPVAPRDYPALLDAAAVRGAAEHLNPLASDFRACFKGGQGRRKVALRRQRVAELKQRLAETLAQSPAARQAIEDALGDFNGRPGESDSFDTLHRLLERQSYRLAFWRVAAHEINYRRFFDINDLAGLRMEQPALFEASHRLVRQLLADGKIQGLRLDHVDGLRGPAQYFERLQQLAASARAARTPAEDPARPLYVLVEKILAPHESLRAGWSVSGTTGYEFMAGVNGLFVDPEGERRLTRFYDRLVGGRLIGGRLDVEAMAVEAKRQVMGDALTSELTVLANLFNRLAKQDRDTRDFSRTGFREALANVVAHFPVYRTYVSEKGASRLDRRDLDWAVGRARRSARTPDTSIYDFIHAVLALDLPMGRRGYRRRDSLRAALKLQQYTGPVMAKAMEDTVFYRYLRLVSLNEVGGEPGKFGTRPAAFHDANQRRLQDYPLSMVTTATHDHKRGEDVRARLNVLSEVARDWTRHVRHWLRLNRRKRREVDGRPAPSLNDEYLFYQTVIGAWPYELAAPDFDAIQPFSARVDAYMRKAAREAKLETSWAAPNEAYESALSDFVARTLDPRQSRPLLENMLAFVNHIALAGAVNGLAQLLLKLASPGVPDIYQGTELWDFSLVDPDNRRPVDYERREACLRAAPSLPRAALLSAWRDGRIKQHIIQRALDARRRDPALFARGQYRPLEAIGPEARRVIAFARTHEGQMLLAVAPRFVWPLVQGQQQPLPQGWGTTHLPLPEDARRNAVLIDAMTGAEIVVPPDGNLPMKQVLADFPVALLLGAGTP